MRSWRGWAMTENKFSRREGGVKSNSLRRQWRKEWTCSLRSFRKCNGAAVRWSESTRFMVIALRDRELKKRWRVDSLTWTSWWVISVNFNFKFLTLGFPLWVEPHHVSWKSMIIQNDKKQLFKECLVPLPKCMTFGHGTVMNFVVFVKSTTG